MNEQIVSAAHDRVVAMDAVRDVVEQLISLTGMQGDAVHVMRHVLMAVVAILLAWLSDVVCRRLVLPAVMKFTAHTSAKWDDIVFNRDVLVAACHIVPAVVVWLLLPLVFYQKPIVEDLLSRATAVYITVMTVRLLLAFVNASKKLDMGDGQRTSTQQYFHSFCGVLRIVVVFVGTVVAVGIVINRSPLSLLAGLGATSAVMMLVFRDTITGLVAGVRLTSNNMLHIGDWITFDKAGVNGVVEEMSLTTVKVRNFDNTIVTVSPTTLVQDSFQNWKGMQQSGGRRVKRMVLFDFHSICVVDDAMKQRLVDGGYFSAKELTGRQINMTLFRRYMERYIASLKEVNPDMTFMVRQLEATSTGLPLEFYFFLKEKSWVEYEHQLADIMDNVYAVTPVFGIKIYQQYPEQ